MEFSFTDIDGKSVVIHDNSTNDELQYITKYGTTHLNGETKNTGKKLIKVLNLVTDLYGNKAFKNRGMNFKLGKNTDIHDWSPDLCESGGLHFTTANNLNIWWSLGCYVAEVSLDPKSKLVTYSDNNNKYKAHEIYITKIWTLSDYICSLDKDLIHQLTAKANSKDADEDDEESESYLHVYTNLPTHNANRYVTIAMIEKLFEHKLVIAASATISSDNVEVLCERYPEAIAHLNAFDNMLKFVEFYNKHKNYDGYFRLMCDKENLKFYHDMTNNKTV